MTKLAYGVGVNDGKYPVWLDGRHLKGYNVWRNLLNRCYASKTQGRNPAYLGCQISENFKNYSYFHDWCLTQIGFGQKGFELDKDLLFKGNKLYSEDTCLFLPKELNSLLTSCRAARGNLPVGVSVVRGKFRARCHTDNPPYHIGYFNTVEEAFNAYKQAKEAFIKSQAEKWKALIDPRAFAALMAYEVLISD